VAAGWRKQSTHTCPCRGCVPARVPCGPSGPGCDHGCASSHRPSGCDRSSGRPGCGHPSAHGRLCCSCAHLHSSCVGERGRRRANLYVGERSNNTLASADRILLAVAPSHRSGMRACSLHAVKTLSCHACWAKSDKPVPVPVAILVLATARVPVPTRLLVTVLLPPAAAVPVTALACSTSMSHFAVRAWSANWACAVQNSKCWSPRAGGMLRQLEDAVGSEQQAQGTGTQHAAGGGFGGQAPSQGWRGIAQTFTACHSAALRTSGTGTMSRAPTSAGIMQQRARRVWHGEG